MEVKDMYVDLRGWDGCITRLAGEKALVFYQTRKTASIVTGLLGMDVVSTCVHAGYTSRVLKQWKEVSEANCVTISFDNTFIVAEKSTEPGIFQVTRKGAKKTVGLKRLTALVTEYTIDLAPVVFTFHYMEGAQ